MSAPKRYPSTPWISQVNPITQEPYKFRISRTRLNGRIVVETAKDSPTSPNETRDLKPSRPGWWPFVQSSQRLLDLTQWDPDTNPDSPAARVQWNKNKQGYAVMSQDVDVLIGLLPRLISGTSGASLRKELQTALLKSTTNSTDVRHVASRTHRYADIMTATHKSLTYLNPIHERMQDRRKMKGYDQTEVEHMRHSLTTAIQALQTLQRQARVGNQAHNPIYKVQPQGDLKAPLAAASFEANLDSFDSDVTPLSPSEQQIAQQQARDPEAEEARQRAFDEAQWAKIKDSMWKGQQPKPKGFAVVPNKDEP